MSEGLNKPNMKGCATVSHPSYWSAKGVRLWDEELLFFSFFNLFFFSPSPPPIALNMHSKKNTAYLCERTRHS